MATLKNLIDETTNIKNELKTCHTNLKNNLNAKGIAVSATDKILNLIDKVGGINGYAFDGDSNEPEIILDYYDPGASYKYASVTQAIYKVLNASPISGFCNVSVSGFDTSSSNSLWGTVYICVNDLPVINFQFGGTQVITKTYQIPILKGDIISIQYKTINTTNTTQIGFRDVFVRANISEF